MCTNLVAKGPLTFPLILYHRTQKRATELVSNLPKGKAIVVASIEDAVSKSDIVFTCVGDDKAVLETIDTAIRGDVKGKLFVDCSTGHPDTTSRLAETLESNGAQFVACPGTHFPHHYLLSGLPNSLGGTPVFGAPAMAEAAQLVCVLAGPASAVDRVKPYTTGVMGRAIIDFSDQPHGKASLLKVIGNRFILNMIESLSEGHVLAEKSGLGVDNLHQFVEMMFPGPYAAYSTRMRTGDYYKRDEVGFIHSIRVSTKKGLMDFDSRYFPSILPERTRDMRWHWLLRPAQG